MNSSSGMQVFPSQAASSRQARTPEMIRKYSIGIAPLSVIIDGEVFHDGVDVTPRDIFRAAEAGKSVRTAAVNTYEYKEFFKVDMNKDFPSRLLVSTVCSTDAVCVKPVKLIEYYN